MIESIKRMASFLTRGFVLLFTSQLLQFGIFLFFCLMMGALHITRPLGFLKFLLVGVVFGLILGINPHLISIFRRPKWYLKGMFIRLKVSIPFALFYVLFIRPVFTGLFWGVGLEVSVAWLLSCLLDPLVAKLIEGKKLAELRAENKAAESKVDRVKLVGLSIKLLLVPLTVVVVFLVQDAYFGLDKPQLFFSAKMLGDGSVEERKIEDMLPPLSEDNTRLVDGEYASYKGSQVLSLLTDAEKSQYVDGEYTIWTQEGKDPNQGHEYWSAFLEYNFPKTNGRILKTFRWLFKDNPPGFIKVDAEHTDKEGQVIRKNPDGSPIKLKILESAHLWHKLSRYAYYQGDMFSKLIEPSCNPDNEGRPWIVYTREKQGILFNGRKVKGVLVIDPQTGQCIPYNRQTKKSPGNIPDWIDRVMPGETSLQYVTDWGRHFGISKEGYIQRTVAGKGRVRPTHMRTFGSDERIPSLIWVKGKDGRPYQFTGLVGIDAPEDVKAVLGYMFVDPRNGKAYWCPGKGLHEDAVLKAVEDSVSNYTGWYATIPCPRIWNKEIVWVSAVNDAHNIFKGAGLVRDVSDRPVFKSTISAAIDELMRDVVRTGGFSSEALTELTVIIHSKNLTQSDLVFGVHLPDKPEEIFIILGPSDELDDRLVASQLGDLIKVKCQPDLKDGWKFHFDSFISNESTNFRAPVLNE